MPIQQTVARMTVMAALHPFELAGMGQAPYRVQGKLEARKLRRELRQQAQQDKVQRALAMLDQPGVRERMDAQPHPYGFEGLTLLGWALWMLNHAGAAGRTRAAQAIEQAAKDVAAINQNGGQK